MKTMSGTRIVAVVGGLGRCLILSGMACGLLSGVGRAAEERDVRTQVDWESFLKRQDPVWERLPAIWKEGAFIGNGRLGAMIYKGDAEKVPGADVLAWTIGRSDLYDNRAPHFDQTTHYRLPIGRMHLCPVGKSAEGNIRIDLWNGEARGAIQTDRGGLEWRSWVQSGAEDSGVVVIDLKTTGGEGDATFKWQAFPAVPPNYYDFAFAFPDYKRNPDGRQERIGETDFWVQPLFVGGDYATAWKVVRPSADRQVIYLAVANRIFKEGAAKVAVDAVDAAARQGVEALQKEHRSWWNQFYPRSFLSIPDGKIENHYWIQLYKLASATREGGVVIDTCGPWLKVDTCWPACWWNLNVQLTQFPVPIANHLHLNEPVIRLLKKELDNGTLINNAPEHMRHDSAYFGNPTITTALNNNDVYWKGQNLSGRSRPGARLNQLPWICHTLWEHYRRNMDDVFLRETVFPLTRRGYSFIFHFLKEGDDGRIHIPDTYSSEYGTADDANEAIAMVQWGCGALLWMCERLDIKDPDIPRWKDIQKRLVDPPVDENGLMIGADVPFLVSHRHYSHMMSLVPFRTWDFEDEKARELAFRSLKWFLRSGENQTGYTYTGASSMYAALGEGDLALETLQRFFRDHDSPTTMYMEWLGVCMETPPSAARCVQDMLLQSHDVIRIFPAVPTAWRDAAFDKLLAEGAFEVGAVRKDGKTKFIRVRSLAGSPCRIKTDIKNPVRLTGAGEVPLTADHAGVITLELKKDEEAVITSKGYDGELNIEPIAVSQTNCYGVKK